MKNLINLKSVGLLVYLVLMAMVLSCTKESIVQNSMDSKRIKNHLVDGKIVSTNIYDDAGRMVEVNSTVFYVGYSYDSNNRLAKLESAFDLSPGSGLSSIYFPNMPERPKVFMTSQNSTVDRYDLYRWDKKGRLSKIECFQKNPNNGKFECTSVSDYEYDGSVTKMKSYNEKGELFQYDVTYHTYDHRGNLTNEKTLTETGLLKQEISYKYDEFKNPLRGLCFFGIPGEFSNVNNIIEKSITFSYYDEYITNKTTYAYQYDDDGYPIKVITEELGSKWEVEYEY